METVEHALDWDQRAGLVWRTDVMVQGTGATARGRRAQEEGKKRRDWDRAL